MSGESKCMYCNKGKEEVEELRPYGKDGQPVCFPCMKADPEREKEAEHQYMEAIKDAAVAASYDNCGIVLIGGESGPVPPGKTN